MTGDLIYDQALIGDGKTGPKKMCLIPVSTLHSVYLLAYRAAYLDEKIHARPSHKCILNNFDCILEALQEYTDSAPADSAAKVHGFANVIGHGNFLLSQQCAAAVLELLENLNCAVQSSGKSAASMISAMKMTVGALNDLRCEDKSSPI